MKRRRNPESMSAEAASTLIRQLGGQGKLVAMIGATNFIRGYEPDGTPSLSFRFKGSKVANGARIALDSDDTYTLRLLKIRGWTVTPVKEISGLYADNLRGAFERATGLYLSLGTMRGNPHRERKPTITGARFGASGTSSARLRAQELRRAAKFQILCSRHGGDGEWDVKTTRADAERSAAEARAAGCSNVRIVPYKHANPKRNPPTKGDDVTKPYQFAKKEEEYQSRYRDDTLRAERDEAMASRDKFDAVARESGTAFYRTMAPLRAAQKAHDDAEKRHLHDAAVYGWHANDVSTLATERNRRKALLADRIQYLKDDMTAFANPRRRRSSR